MIDVPLRLWNRPHWELKGRVDPVRFFAVLKAAFPTATTFFVEGTSMAKDVEEFFCSANEAGPRLPAPQTIWPHAKRFRLPADDSTLERLGELAASHAGPEILDHFFVYAGSEPLMEYPDAFDCPIYVSDAVGEPQIRWFANELRLKVAEVGTA